MVFLGRLEFGDCMYYIGLWGRPLPRRHTVVDSLLAKGLQQYFFFMNTVKSIPRAIDFIQCFVLFSYENAWSNWTWQLLDLKSCFLALLPLYPFTQKTLCHHWFNSSLITSISISDPSKVWSSLSMHFPLQSHNTLQAQNNGYLFPPARFPETGFRELPCVYLSLHSNKHPSVTHTHRKPKALNSCLFSPAGWRCTWLSAWARIRDAGEAWHVEVSTHKTASTCTLLRYSKEVQS